MTHFEFPGNSSSASSAASALGVEGAFESRRMLWESKVNHVKHFESEYEKRIKLFGHVFESVARDDLRCHLQEIFGEENVKIDAMLEHRQCRSIHCCGGTPDGILTLFGSLRVLIEIKTRYDNEIYELLPVRYYIQQMIYMEAYNIQYSILWCWSINKGKRLFMIEWNQDNWEKIKIGLLDFDHYVRTRTPPPKLKRRPLFLFNQEVVGFGLGLSPPI